MKIDNNTLIINGEQETTDLFFDDELLGSVIQHLRNLKEVRAAITKIQFNYCNIGYLVARSGDDISTAFPLKLNKFGALLLNNLHIRTVEFSHCKMDGENNLSEFGTVLRENAKSLDAIIFRNNRISIENAQQLASDIGASACIKSFIFEGHSWKTYQAEPAPTAMFFESEVTEAPSNEPPARPSTIQAPIITPNSHSKLRLTLLQSSEKCSCVTPFAEILSSTRTLQHLGFVRNYLDDRGVEIFANKLSLNGTLLSLDLSHNCIADEGFKTLFSALWKHPTLTTVNLSCNSITEEGARAFLAFLENAPLRHTVIEFLLEDNTIGAVTLMGIQSTIADKIKPLEEVPASVASAINVARDRRIQTTPTTLAGAKQKFSWIASSERNLARDVLASSRSETGASVTKDDLLEDGWVEVPGDDGTTANDVTSQNLRLTLLRK